MQLNDAQIDRIRKLELSAGDIVVVNSAGPLCHEQRLKIGEAVRAALFNVGKHKTPILLMDDLEISVLCTSTLGDANGPL